MGIVRALKEFRNVVDILPSPVTEIFYYFTVISSRLHLVSRGQTAFFRLSLGWRKKSLDQFTSRTRLNTNLCTGSVNNRNAMHTHIVTTSACCYKRNTCMDELMDQVMDVKAAMDLAIYIYDLAVQGMGELDSVTCLY